MFRLEPRRDRQHKHPLHRRLLQPRPRMILIVPIIRHPLPLIHVHLHTLARTPLPHPAQIRVVVFMSGTMYPRSDVDVSVQTPVDFVRMGRGCGEHGFWGDLVLGFVFLRFCDSDDPEDVWDGREEGV